MNLEEYKGKVLLIVNTATGCGFRFQYDGLQNIYEKYKEKGFEILDFICNQFGEQASGTVEEIEEKMSGIICGRRGTSCADQLAKAVKKAFEESKTE